VNLGRDPKTGEKIPILIYCVINSRN